MTAALAALRAQVESDRAAGAIDSDGIANSLLVKLRLGDDANNGVAGELQTTTFRYDANGNRINKEFPGPQGPRIQGTDYAYDPENRLIEAHDYQENLNGNRVDRQVTRLDHDGDGRRLVKEYDPKDGGGGTKRVEYVFDGLDPVAEYNLWNPQYENFYRGDLGRILTMHHFPAGTQGQMYWYHYDGLGSTAGLTKQRGQSSHNYRYEPYGQIEMPPGNFTDPHNHYTFTGQELDEAMGVYEFFARAYDYDTGTWLTQDIYRGTLTIPQSLHRLVYVENNPVSYYDWYGYKKQQGWMAGTVKNESNQPIEIVDDDKRILLQPGKSYTDDADAVLVGCYSSSDQTKCVSIEGHSSGAYKIGSQDITIKSNLDGTIGIGKDWNDAIEWLISAGKSVLNHENLPGWISEENADKLGWKESGDDSCHNKDSLEEFLDILKYQLKHHLPLVIA